MNENKLEKLASLLGGSIVDIQATEACHVHEAALATQELITSGGSVHRRTICPFANREECDHQEQVVLVLDIVEAA